MMFSMEGEEELGVEVMFGIEGLPVNGFVVTFRGHHFWRQIVWCSAKRPGDIWDFFGKAEVGNLQMTVSIQEQVLGLEIAIYYIE